MSTIHLKTILPAIISIVLTVTSATAQNYSELRGEVDETALRRSYESVVANVVREFLKTEEVGRESVQAYFYVVGDASRKGVHLQRRPLRSNDQRHLGAALLILMLEERGMGYDRIYDLRLDQNR